MANVQILQRLVNTKISSDQSKEMIGKIIRKEFDSTESEERAFELLQIAFRWNLPQFSEMIDDYAITDFKWLA